MSNIAFLNSQSSTGVCTATAPAVPGVTWNLTSLQISQAGPTLGPNAKVTIYDGAVGGTVLAAYYLSGPGAFVAAGTAAVATLGSVGIIQDIPLPKDPFGRQGVQSTPGNAMNIQVVGTGANVVSINARVSDGIPGFP